MTNWRRRALLILMDIVGLNAAVVLGLAIRFEGAIPAQYLVHLARVAVPYTFAALIVFHLLGQYQTLFRYASVDEVWRVVEGVTTTTLIFIVMIYLTGTGFPRSVFILNWVLGVVMLGGVRLWERLSRSLLPASLRRLLLPHTARLQIAAADTPMRNVLIVGAGDAGAMVVRELLRHPEMGRHPVGFLDDDPRKRHLTIRGVPVRGARRDLRRVITEVSVQEVLLAIPSAPVSVVREVVQECRALNLHTLILPGVYELIDQKVTVNHIREVQIEDLIGRQPVRLDMAEIAQYLRGQRVLVTGAGGSIGSELCRQVARFEPAELILLGHGENSIFETALDLQHRYPDLHHHVVVGDIRDRRKVDRVFDEYKPTVVFHAAAHKHVPLMEDQPDEAVKTNIFGTQNVAEAAKRHGAHRFVMISTDKAVNPTSVMGATKRVAEMIVQSLNASGPGPDGAGSTKFCAVRFGNVLGSRGSVVPVFKQQIARGGPVTVTDPEMQRYFMTIPEAVQLVIQAGAMGQGGEVFVLDMGEPIRIVDLARNLIQLSGFEPDVDIPIVFTGVRPGEKLFEEILTAEEGTDATRHQRIYVARTHVVPLKELERTLDELEHVVFAGLPGSIMKSLRQIIPRYGQTARALDSGETSGLETAERQKPPAYIHPVEEAAEMAPALPAR